MKYKVTWRFGEGRQLVRLIPAPSLEIARKRAEAENYQRPIFRRANLYTRSTSAYEYLDHFPVPTEVLVETSSY